MKEFFLIYIFLISSLFSFCQEKEIPESIIPKKIYQNTISTDFLNYKKQAISLTKYLPKNFSKKGDIDYTKYIQKGLRENKIVVFPNFPILINDSGLTISSNSILLFENNSRLLLRSSKKDTYEILRLHNVQNIKIYYANIIGDSKHHIGKSGEWGMGIAIRSSSNIDIYNPIINYCWGDGIYVGQLKEKVNGNTIYHSISKNIKIYNALVNNSGRNGLSIVGVDGINIYNSCFANSKRTFPKSGIDIEPGPGITNNVVISNCVTFNNGARGIDFMFRKLPKMKIREINILVKNHVDHSSPIGLRIAGYKDSKIDAKNSKIKGVVIIEKPIMINNRINALDIELNQSLAPIFVFRDYKFNELMTKKLKKVTNYNHIFLFENSK